MKKTTALLSASLVALCTLAAPAAHAAGNGWQWLPALNDPSWKPEASVALTGNRTNPGTGPKATGWGVDVKIPSKGSSMTTAMAQNNGELAFMVDMPDAGSDNTIFDEVERRKLELEERAKANQAAMQQQEGGDGVKP